MRVLVTDRLEAGALAKLREAGHEVIERSGLQGAELVAALEGCGGLIVRGATKVTAGVLRGASSLRVVIRAGTGLDNIDVAVARERGVTVSNTPAANAVSVAELVFGLLVALERHLVPAVEDLRRGRWERARFEGRELCGRTLGLVGFGRIGREVATRARAFGLTVLAFDPLLSEWPAEYGWARRVPLDAMLPAVDILSLHVPLTPETRGLIGARALSLMRPDAILVNCARGGVVEEGALHAALAGGALRGAALDVFEREPPGEAALLSLPNVIATPHLGASTVEAQRRAGLEAAEIMIRSLRELPA